MSARRQNTHLFTACFPPISRLCKSVGIRRKTDVVDIFLKTKKVRWRRPRESERRGGRLPVDGAARARSKTSVCRRPDATVPCAWFTGLSYYNTPFHFFRLFSFPSRRRAYACNHYDPPPPPPPPHRRRLTYTQLKWRNVINTTTR